MRFRQFRVGSVVLLAGVVLICVNAGIALGASTNASVTFIVPSKNGLAKNCWITITVKKTGKTSIVAGQPGAGQVSGTHQFPAGTAPAAIAAYYDGLLKNAGWDTPADYKVSGATIHFYGVTQPDKAAGNESVKISTTTDSAKVKWNQVPKSKWMKVVRSSNKQDGMITLVAFGISWDTQNQEITTTTSEVTVHFLATDSGDAVLQKIQTALTGAGWTAAINPDGWLVISKNEFGDWIYSLRDVVEYQGSGSNDDDWILEEG